MKYIRTKEHIYKRLFVDRAIINECGYGSCDKDLNPTGETIIKESDNLEELCDEYVLVEKSARCFLNYDEITEDDLRLCLQDHDIFGAIWTEWGLKYVAKMNSKGELELL